MVDFAKLNREITAKKSSLEAKRKKLNVPFAPRGEGISHAAAWCWKVAEFAHCRYLIKEIGTAGVAWPSLDAVDQDMWYWRAKAVMAALDILE